MRSLFCLVLVFLNSNFWFLFTNKLWLLALFFFATWNIIILLWVDFWLIMLAGFNFVFCLFCLQIFNNCLLFLALNHNLLFHQRRTWWHGTRRQTSLPLNIFQTLFLFLFHTRLSNSLCFIIFNIVKYATFVKQLK